MTTLELINLDEVESKGVTYNHSGQLIKVDWRYNYSEFFLGAEDESYSAVDVLVSTIKNDGLRDHSVKPEEVLKMELGCEAYGKDFIRVTYHPNECGCLDPEEGQAPCAEGDWTIDIEFERIDVEVLVKPYWKG